MEELLLSRREREGNANSLLVAAGGGDGAAAEDEELMRKGGERGVDGAGESLRGPERKGRELSSLRTAHRRAAATRR